MLQDKSPQKPHNVHNLANSPSRFNRKYVARHPPVRQCTLVRTVPPADMPAQVSANTEMKYKKEAERVSEKVTKTRHEIEELKAQLQQLINEGISKTDSKQNLSANQEGKTLIDDRVHEEIENDVADTFRVDDNEKKPTPSILKPSGIKQTSHDVRPKKVRHYDQEMAREYIKKQREKRKEEINQNIKKNATALAEIRKQRLQQLREKSLQLLSKNVDRARSRSRSREAERNKTTETVKYNTEVSLYVSNPSLENQPKLLHPQLHNITLRSRQRNNVSEMPNYELREKSAIKIQAAFRGHRQRKFYEEMKTRKKQMPLEVPNLPEKVPTQHINHHVPPIMPYPYNFINAVKRKLNLVTRQTIKVDTVDVAIQSSLADDLKSPKLDLKSFLSHKCLEPLTIFNKKSSSKHTVNVENGCVSESDTSKDIPELSSENTISESLQRRSVHCTKRSHSTDTDPTLNINVEGVKKLKLRQPKLVESEVSEHLSEPTGRLSSSRDSIIASNECNYVTSSNSVAVEKSVSIVSNEPVVSNQMTYMKEQKDTNTYNFDNNKDNVSQVTTAQDKSKSSRAYSSNFTNITTDIPMLETPKVSLKASLPISSSEESDAESVKRLITNVRLKTGEKSTLETKAKTNEIHLKFEAELHLLNDFNDSLRRVMAVEKSLLELHEKKHEATLNYENRDTQTSIDQQNQIANINYSRGSDVTEAFSINKDLSFVTTSLNLSPFNSPIEESNSEDIGDKEKLKFPNVLGGISLEMFEQLIKDEDARIENLKAILKIREKSLVDRTKGELAWLEVQKKHLRDAGQLQEISAIKKKQRGLLIKLEHERHEMQRLKQMQKAASKERKTVLREQRNMIKAQLAAGNTVTRIKRNTREQKRQSGPFKVYNIQSNNDSIVSETSVTRKSSITEEVVSATSNHSHSIVSHISEELIFSEKIQLKSPKDTSVRAENVKRSLLMREAALQKRKKVAEELLQWHQRLLDEERKITELELAASAIINQVPISKDSEESMSAKQSFKGSQLNQLWLSLTGRSEKKFKDEEIYNMSQTSLEKFCRNAKKYERVAPSQKRSRIPDAKKTAKTNTTIPIEDVSKGEINDYVSDFESVVTSASSVSEHTQSSSDSTLSNHEVTTVTEITKPSVNQNAKHDQVTDDSTIISTNGGEVRSECDQKSAPVSVNVTKISSEVGSESDQKSASESRLVSVNETKISSEVGSDSDHKSASESRKISSEVESESDQKSASESRLISVNETNISSEVGSESDQKSPSESRLVSVNETKISSEIGSESDEKSPSESRPVSVNETKIFSDAHHQISSKTVVDQILSEIDKYLDSQLNSLGDGTLASKSISNDVSESIVNRDSAQISTSICDKTQVIDDVSDINETDVKSSTVSESESLETETVGTEEFNDKKDVVIEKLSKIAVDILQDASEPDPAAATKSSGSNQSSGVPELTDEINSNKEHSTVTSEKEHTEISEGILPTNSEENSKHNDYNTNSKKVIESSIRELNLSTGHRKSEDTISLNLGEFYKSDCSGRVSENLSKNKDESSFVSLLEETNKSEDTTVSTVSELNKTKSSDPITKQTTQDDVSVSHLKLLVETSSSEIREKLKESNHTSSNIFNELPYKNDATIYSGTKIRTELIPNGHLKIKLDSTTSYITEIDEDQDTPSKVTNAESDGIDNSPNVLDLKNSEIGDKSPSGTIDSITEIEEDELFCENSKDRVESIHDEVSQKFSANNSTVTGTNEISSIREEQVSSSDDSTNTEPRSSLSYGYVDEKDHSVKDEETTTSKPLSNNLDAIKGKTTDIKKRVSEILADANISSPRGDRSPRLQDFYVTAYDVVSPNNTPETTSPVDDAKQTFPPQNVFGTDEVEELLKKQLEIEQEIKAIQQLQQKEQLPYLYVREIPNKPPPPYTPPINAQSSPKGSVLPSGDREINVITTAAAQILNKAAATNNIKDVALKENSKKYLELKSNVEGQCYEFIFDLSKEFALDHYKQFEPDTGPSWMHLQKKTKLAIGRPFDQTSLQKFISKKVKQVLGHEVVTSNENLKHKWSGKKRDHVDELLVVECQAEEVEWTNYDRDELIVKDELTKEIMNMLLSETGQVLNNILSKKKYLC